jgi:hypothetical protein
MHRIVLTLVFALVIAAAGMPAVAEVQLPAPPNVNPDAQGAKLPAEDFELPAGTNAVTEPRAGATPQLVTRNGCIFFPGQTVTYRFVAARGNNFYRVTPARFFDVKMKVALAGFRAVTIDRFFAGGTERFNFFNPPPYPRRVAVTISGFRGSTGCFTFVAAP